MPEGCSTRELNLCLCEAKSLKTSQCALHCFEGHWITKWPLVCCCPNEFEMLGPCNYFLWGPKRCWQEEWQPFNLRQGDPFQMLLQLVQEQHGNTLCSTSPAQLPGFYNAVVSNLQSACQPRQVAGHGIHVRQEALLCYHVDVMVIITGITT